MKTEITPLPWQHPNQFHKGIYGGKNQTLIVTIQPTFDKHVMHEGIERDYEAQANADYIVKACNLYPELVEALETMIKAEEARRLEDDPAAITQMEWTELDPFRAVLAKAKEDK